MRKMPEKLFSTALKTARSYNASDIHLIANLPPTFRVSGEIVVAPNHDPLSRDELNQLTKTLLTDEQLVRFEKERELCISYYHEKYGRIRLSLYHRLGVAEVAIRMCNQEIKSAEALRLPSVIDELAKKTSGMIIITGATGMGKTTTMNYIIDLINASRRVKIITIEDPVEFEHKHKKSIITQIEVGTDTHDFAHCLRHVLRLDPDVIAVGEMRDLDTMETTLAAAETGHLVLATLHTPSAAGTVERVVSSFDGSRQPQVTQQLSSILQGVIAQRLITTIDKKSRVLATETIVANDAVRSLIREEKISQIYNTITTSRHLGMHTLEHSLVDLYQQGLISIDQVYSNANRLENIKILLGSYPGL